MDIDIRAEITSDIVKVREINRLAFKQSDEADIVDKLRQQRAIKLSLVAVNSNNEIIGHIAFSDMTFENKNSQGKIIGLAPMAVLPEFQKQGVGSQLIEAGIKACKKLNYDAIFILGHTNYYPKFGFQIAKHFDLSCEYPVPDEAFMVLPLKQDALQSMQGLVFYHEVFR